MSTADCRGVPARLAGWAHPASMLIRSTMVGLRADGLEGGDGGDGGGGRPSFATNVSSVWRDQ